MCIFTGTYKFKKAKGYKLVLKIDDKYISLFTGMEYIEGSFVNPPNQMDGFINWREKGERTWDGQNFYGYTSIYNTLEDVQWFKEQLIHYTPIKNGLESRLVILEMTLTTDLKNSYMVWNSRNLDTVSGKFIKKIKEYGR